MKIAFFDAKSYDRHVFDEKNDRYEISYVKNKLSHHTVGFTKGYDVVCAFVNDDLNAKVMDGLHENGVKLIAMRCAGYSNVDLKKAQEYGIPVVRVPAYSPHAVAEFAIGLLLSVNRKIHKAYNRTRDFNFSIVRLEGTDLHGKTVGVIGTGKIGKVFIELCKGFGMKVIAYDVYPDESADLDYVSLDTLFENSDIISLHCPLTDQTHHIVDQNAFSKMKPGAYLINTSRGALVDSEALLATLREGKLRGVALDVYEEEADYFYEDMSLTKQRNENLAVLLSFPQVIITSHQAYLTKEALGNIAECTLENIRSYFEEGEIKNQVCL